VVISFDTSWPSSYYTHTSRRSKLTSVPLLRVIDAVALDVFCVVVACTTLVVDVEADVVVACTALVDVSVVVVANNA
jgi:hypothetical protein